MNPNKSVHSDVPSIRFVKLSAELPLFESKNCPE